MTFLGKIKTVAIAATFVVGAATMSSALTFGSIPQGATNDGLQPLFGQDDRNGWYGASLFLVGGPVDLEVSYLGSEAGFNNRFFWDGNLLFSTGGNTNTWGTLAAPLATQTFMNVSSGLLTFGFGDNSAVETVSNGANPDDSMGQAGPNFFVSFENENAGGGQIAYLFFDDSGAGPDDNHDDMVIRIRIVGGDGHLQVIPLPAAGWLLLGGLGGLMALRRRRKDAA